MLKDGLIEAQVSFVSKDEIDFEIEIKAVTTHEFAFRKVEKGETIASDWESVPSFDGPGWYGMSSSTSKVANIPARSPIGPIIIHNRRTGMETGLVFVQRAFSSRYIFQ